LSRLGPLYAAVAIFPLIAAGAALPYVALTYRRRGAIGAGQLLLAGLFGLYLVGVAFAVILPLRPVSPDFCELFAVNARYNPIDIVNAARLERAGGGISAVLRDARIQDVILNVILFVPLGMFIRHMLRRGFAVTLAIGLGASLLIELTQLTGNWGLYPCAYRFFATSDLIANTLGAGIGAVLAPLLRLIPGQAAVTDPSERQRVSPGRRYLAALSNVALVVAIGFALLAVAGLVLDASRGQLFLSESLRSQALRAFALVLIPGSVVFLAIPLAWQGRTPGEWAVLLRPANTGPGSAAPQPVIVVARFAAVQAPLLILAATAVAGIRSAWIALVLLAGLHAWLVYRAKEWRGGAELRLGIQITDSR